MTDVLLRLEKIEKNMWIHISDAKYDDINKLNESDIYEKIDILGKVGCMSDHIKNIFICNPYYLTRNSKDINKLIDEHVQKYEYWSNYQYKLLETKKINGNEFKHYKETYTYKNEYLVSGELSICGSG